jgi:hypothetical protein
VYKNQTSLGLANMGNGQLVSDSPLDLPLSIAPYFPYIKWESAVTLCRAVELWFSMEMPELPRGRYVLFDSDEYTITYVVTMGLCLRRYFEIQDGDTGFYAFVDMNKLQYVLNISGNHFEYSHGLPFQLSAIKHRSPDLDVANSTFTLCVGQFQGFHPACVTADTTLGGFGSGDPASSYLEHGSAVAAIYYVAAFDVCLTLADVSMLYENIPLANRRGITIAPRSNRTIVSFTYPSQLPTKAPTNAPTSFPTLSPTGYPTVSSFPTLSPTETPI